MESKMMQVDLRQDEDGGVCACGQVEDHPVAWRRTLDGWGVVGWSSSALVLEASALELGAVAYRAVVFTGVRDLWGALDAVALEEAEGVADRVLGPGPKGRMRRMLPPAPPVGEGVRRASS